MSVPKDQRILDRRLVNETVFLSQDGTDILLRCTLENCRVVIDCNDHMIGVRHSQLLGCTLEFKRKLKNTKLFSNDFIGCSFDGRFSGVDFGRSPRPDPLTNQLDKRGDLTDCDFTHATLDLCRFFNVELNRQRFAPWPQFVIPQVYGLEAAKRNRTWPGRFADYLLLLAQEDSQVTGSTGTLTDFKKTFALTDEELVQALVDIGGVIR